MFGQVLEEQINITLFSQVYSRDEVEVPAGNGIVPSQKYGGGESLSSKELNNINLPVEVGTVCACNKD